MAISPDNLHQLIFRTDTGKQCVIMANENMTTANLISSVAAAMNVSKDKIGLTLNGSLDIKGRGGLATQENAKDVDEAVQKQFKTNIVNFIARDGNSRVMVKKD